MFSEENNGTGITFAMWWLYDLLPSARALREHRHRAAAWGFGRPEEHAGSLLRVERPQDLLESLLLARSRR